MTVEEFLDYGYYDMRPKKGDPKIDLRGLIDYCREHNIPRGENGYPKEIVERFIIGVYEYGRDE